MSPVARPIALAGLLLAATSVLTGCGAGSVVDPAKTGIAVRYDVERATGAKVAKVRCPEAIAVRVGNRFSCRVTSRSGRVALVELEVTSEQGDLRALGIKAP